MSLSFRAHAVKVATKRELKSTLYGVGLYITLFLVFLTTSYFFVNSTIRNVIEEGITSLGNPITAPFFASVGLAATYLGLCSALSISRERDQGTLEVLFYGPIDAVTFVLAKYFHQIFAFLVALAFAIVNFYLIARLTNLGFSTDFLGLILLSVFLTSCMVSFGIFLSAASKRMMVSVILFLGLVIFFLGFFVAHAVVMSFPEAGLSPLIIYVRVVLDNLNAVMQWISPISYFIRGSSAVFMGNTGEVVVSLIASAAYSVVLLAASVWLFERKGVRR